MNKALILLALVGYVAAQSCPPAGKVVVCYYASWSIYRPDLGYFNASNIDASLCTHLVYTFAGLNQYFELASLDYANDVTINGGYKHVNDLKLTNPCLKTLLAIGGWNEGSRKYSAMAYTPESRAAFADSVLRYVVYYGFDGFDVDWEYPTQRGGIAEDKNNFVLLLQTLRSKLAPWNLLLTVALPLAKSILETSFTLSEVATYVDYVFLMAYDATAVDSKVTGLMAPMSSIDESVTYCIQNMPSTKLVLGIPSYARSFFLESTFNHGIGSTTKGLGMAGAYTKEPGFLSYYELQEALTVSQFTVVSTTEVNYYAYFQNDWITYDTVDTITTKVNYAKTQNLGGIMLWTIDTDDFMGLYGETKYPVLQLINIVLYT